MSLINIEYGSLASSETMNKNFLYLENKIGESSSSIMTSISSILSNIATINNRLDDLSENLVDYSEEFDTKLKDYKSKTKALVNKATMVPNWKAIVPIELNENFTVPENGYILAIPKNNSEGSLIINEEIAITIKQQTNAYDNSSQLLTIPAKKADIVTTDLVLAFAYFIPVTEVSVEEF